MFKPLTEPVVLSPPHERAHIGMSVHGSSDRICSPITASAEANRLSAEGDKVPVMAAVMIGDHRDGFELNFDHLRDDEARHFIRHLNEAFSAHGGYWLNLGTEDGVATDLLRWLPAQVATVMAYFDEPLTEHHQLSRYLNRTGVTPFVHRETDPTP